MKRCVLVFILFMSMITAMAQETSEMAEVIEMHDVVMAKMPKLVKLINELQTASQKSDDNKAYKNAISELKTENKTMQKWMENFGKLFDVDEMMKGKKLTAQKQEWLNDAMATIKTLDKDVDSSFTKVEALLNK
ncbi:hypothetical protein [Aurantibacter sp.]|uniref:hypothetical protein n=1 Tax=Aurantibacter sp. TaxID=2807103 RepID=UPI00326526A9